MYVGPGGVLTGTARISQEAEAAAADKLLQQEIERRRREIERKRAAAEAQITSLRADLEAGEEELKAALAQAELKRQAFINGRDRMSGMRGKDDSQPV